MRTAGWVPGMASTSGVYINEELQQAGDLAGSGGHHLLFESRAINMGVLETARGAVAHSGFMFDWCDVGVCLNVTADHLGEFGVHTLEDMTTIKRSIVARARRAVVLNADYPTCVSMLPFAAGVSVYLAAVESSLETVRSLAGEPVHACVREQDNGVDSIVLYEPDGNRVPLMPVTDIPATMGGAAGFNINNAQHAVCACHALGVGIETIREGLAGFDASFENNPGRLNIHRGLPFTVIMDYAHNPDGMKKLGEFIERLDVPGRRILMYAVTGNRTNLEVTAFTRTPIGLFDHFVCRSYPQLRGREPGEIPALMKTALLEAGVPEERITVVKDPEDASRQALNLARPGDLVVLAVGAGEFERLWNKITCFEPATSA
jgi:cyanophycin synthetase